MKKKQSTSFPIQVLYAEDNPKTGWPWSHMQFPNSWWVVVRPSEQLGDERAGWKAQHLLTWRRQMRAAKVSYLVTY